MSRHLPLRHWFVVFACLLLAAIPSLRADEGDVDDSGDFKGWDRMAGYVITDYDEDNPSDYTFPVARPTTADSSHRDAVPVQGHRYVIRYEWNLDKAAPTVRQVQRHFERVARESDYTVEKGSTEGDSSETFHRKLTKHQIWVYLVPEAGAYTITVVDSRTIPSSAPAPTPSTAQASPPTNAAAATPPSAPSSPAPSSAVPTTAATDDPLYAALLIDGRVVLPVKFEPGKPDLAPGAQPVIDRVIAILQSHPELNLTIEGHTDLTGNEDFNQTLSEERARTVRSLLIAGHISRKRLNAVGMGGTQPIADESTAEGREKNRRIELVVRKDGGTQSAASVSAKTPPGLQPVEAPGASFHGTAPDGVNYYPKNSAGPTPP